MEKDLKLEMSKVHIKLDKILELFEGQSGNTIAVQTAFDPQINFPLLTIEMIQIFKAKLADKTYL